MAQRKLTFFMRVCNNEGSENNNLANDNDTGNVDNNTSNAEENNENNVAVAEIIELEARNDGAGVLVQNPQAVADEAGNDDHGDDEGEANQQRAPTTPRVAVGFLAEWRTRFSWLKPLGGYLVLCTTCANNKKSSNDWSTGKLVTTWDVTDFRKHDQSRTHGKNMSVPRLRKEMAVATATAHSKAEEQTIGLMINILAAIQNELSIRKVPFLHELADLHISRAVDGNPAGNGPMAIVSTKHRSSFSTYKLMKAMNTTQLDADRMAWTQALSICIHIDETTDITNTKLLMVYLTIVSREADPKLNGEMFGTVLEIEGSANAENIAHILYTWVVDSGIDPKKIVMFTSDGAAVMLGRHSGVAKRLRKDYDMPHLLEYHCICHRENLAVKEAYQKSPPFVNLEIIIKDVITFLSTNRNLTGLKRYAKELKMILYAPHRIKEIRWLSRFQVLGEMVKSMVVILTFLENKIAEDPNDHLAKPTHRRLSKVKNLVLLFHLYDMLAPINKLMVKLQREDLHPFEASEYVRAAITHIEANYVDRDVDVFINGRYLRKLITKIQDGAIRPTGEVTDELRSQCDGIVTALAADIVKCMKERLWNNNKIVKQMRIFHAPPGMTKMTKQEFTSYGEKELESLVEHYQGILDIDLDEIMTEWQIDKYTYIKRIMDGDSDYPWKGALRKCVDEPDLYSNLSKIAAVLLSFNAQNATVERAFSLVTRLRSKLRNRLLPETLDLVIRLRVSTCHYEYFQYDTAVVLYSSMHTYSMGKVVKRRRLIRNDESTDEDEDDNDLHSGLVEPVQREVFREFVEMIDSEGI